MNQKPRSSYEIVKNVWRLPVPCKYHDERIVRDILISCMTGSCSPAEEAEFETHGLSCNKRVNAVVSNERFFSSRRLSRTRATPRRKRAIIPVVGAEKDAAGAQTWIYKSAKFNYSLQMG